MDYKKEQEQKFDVFNINWCENIEYTTHQTLSLPISGQHDCRGEYCMYVSHAPLEQQKEHKRVMDRIRYLKHKARIIVQERKSDRNNKSLSRQTSVRKAIMPLKCHKQELEQMIAEEGLIINTPYQQKIDNMIRSQYHCYKEYINKCNKWIEYYREDQKDLFRKNEAINKKISNIKKHMETMTPKDICE
jgi:hypothetical protein